MTDTSNRRTKLLAEYLAVTSIACPSCRHDLRGSSGDRCPECGVALRVRIDSPAASASILWWIGLFGSALAAAISLRLVLASLDKIIALVDDPTLPMIVRGGFAPSSALPNWTGVALLTLCCLGSLACIASLLALRRRFALMRLPLRLVLGIVLFAMPIIILGIVRLYVTMAP